MAAVLACYCCLRNSEKTRQQERTEYTVAEPDVQSLQVFTTNSYTVINFLILHGEKCRQKMDEFLLCYRPNLKQEVESSKNYYTQRMFE